MKISHTAGACSKFRQVPSRPLFLPGLFPRGLALLGLLLFGTQALCAAQLDRPARDEVARTLSRIVAREVSGGAVQVQRVDATAKRVRVYASMGLSYYPFRPQNLRAMYDSVRLALPAQYRKADVELYTDSHEASELIPMAYRSGAALRKQLRAKKVIPFTNRSERPLVTRLSSAAPRPDQGLSGRHIALWQSHGRYFDQSQNRWEWQRALLWQTVEDLYTQSYVLPYLVPMLENAGANVLLPRERDTQTIELLCDNDREGTYREQTGAQPWQAGAAGFAHIQNTYLTGENPFRHGTTRHVRSVTTGAESQALWQADIPQGGEYAVYVSYDSTSESADDAHYTVHHIGGDFTCAVNQTMGGGTWIYLGRFVFAPGVQEVVTLSNRSRKAGRVVSADAVKIGGGYGNVARTPCDSLRRPDVDYRLQTSGYPRFCEGARYWLQWAGFDERVYTPKQNKDDYRDDYMSRAHWVNALMGGSERLPDSAGLRIPIDLALAFHSDAGVRAGDEVVGTLGIYYTKENKGRFDGGADRYRSRDLTDMVMTRIVDDIRHTFEPEWKRRGMWNRAYYEARMPAAPTMLLELLSHQNFADMRYGHDPRFKFLVSRAVYKGILQYIGSQYGLSKVTVQPLPVEALSVEFAGDDRVHLRWLPVDDPLETSAKPTGYVVYTRVDDGGFDNGRYVDKPALVTAQEPGRIYSYKVTAVNAGGEGFPSETVATCRVPEERGRVLIVNGFDRVSAPLSMRRDSLEGFYNDIDAGVPDRADISFTGAQYVFDKAMESYRNDSLALGASHQDFATEPLAGNTFDHAITHGRSIANAGYSFCSVSVRSVELSKVKLETYPVIDLLLGEQRSTTIGRGFAPPVFKTFSTELQHALRRYATAGGALFVSGSYVATDLWRGEAGAETESRIGSEVDRAFAREVLHYTYDRGRAARRGRVRVVPVATPRIGPDAAQTTVAARSETSFGPAEPAFTPAEYHFIDTERPDRYRVESPDALLPADAGSFAVMRYVENNRIAAVAGGGGAAFVSASTSTSESAEPVRSAGVLRSEEAGASARTLVMGFPFEAITTAEERDRLMADVLEFLLQ